MPFHHRMSTCVKSETAHVISFNRLHCESHQIHVPLLTPPNHSFKISQSDMLDPADWKPTMKALVRTSNDRAREQSMGSNFEVSLNADLI